MLGALTFEVKVDMFFVGGRGGLRSFVMGVLAGYFDEMTSPLLTSELICCLICLGPGEGLAYHH